MSLTDTSNGSSFGLGDNIEMRNKEREIKMEDSHLNNPSMKKREE